MESTDTIFYIIVLIMSVVVHEVAHGLAADSQGDPTARYAGRLTLNPLRHIDMFGSVIVPIILVLTKATFLIGWAKPVPYNENNLRNKKWGTVFVAGAGIIANFALAVIFGLAIRFSLVLGITSPAFISIATAITKINLVLGFFNLVPLPPLDGSKILFSLLGAQSIRLMQWMEKYSIVILLAFIFIVWPLIIPLVQFLFVLLTGLSTSLL